MIGRQLPMGVRPHCFLILLIFAVPLGYQESFAGTPGYYLPELVIAAAGSLLLIPIFRRGQPIGSLVATLARASTVAALSPFLIVILVSGLLYPTPSAAKELVRWGELVCLAAASRLLISKRESLLRVLTASAVATGAQSAVVIGQILTRDLIYPGRPTGTFGQPNPLGAYLAFNIPMVLGLGLDSKDRNLRTLYAGVLCIAASAIAFSASRAAMIALGVAWAWMLFLYPERRQFLRWSSALLAGLAVSAGIPGSRVIDPFGLTGRLRIHQLGLAIAADHPLLGIGTGRFKEFAAKLPEVYQGLAAGTGLREVDYDLHSLYLKLLVENGILGLGTFLTGLGFLLVVVHRALRTRQASTSDSVHLGLAAGALAFLLSNLSGFFVVHGMGILFGMVLGLAFRPALSLPRSDEVVAVGQ